MNFDDFEEEIAVQLSGGNVDVTWGLINREYTKKIEFSMSIDRTASLDRCALTPCDLTPRDLEIGDVRSPSFFMRGREFLDILLCVDSEEISSELVFKVLRDLGRDREELK